MEEEWRAVIGFEGVYEVSSMGRVRRVSRIRLDGSGPTLKYGMSGRKNRQYQFVRLSNLAAGILKQVVIHKLVAAAFIGPRPLGMHINHIDGNKCNNRADNLEYVTPKANRIHAIANRLMPRKLSDESVREIRSLLGSITMSDIARRYQIHKETVRDIRDGQMYSWLE